MMKQQILAKIEESFLIAEKFYNRTFSRPNKIVFREKGSTLGGYSNYYTKELMFNLGYCAQNPELYIKTTVPHEVAHWINDEVYGKQRTQNGRRISHGRTWKYIMTCVFRLPPDRCMEKEFNGAAISARKVTRHKYTCGCRIHEITTIRHNRIQSGQQRRHCLYCRQTLTLHVPSVQDQIAELQKKISQLENQ